MSKDDRDIRYLVHGYMVRHSSTSLIKLGKYITSNNKNLSSPTKQPSTPHSARFSPYPSPHHPSHNNNKVHSPDARYDNTHGYPPSPYHNYRASPTPTYNSNDMGSPTSTHNNMASPVPSSQLSQSHHSTPPPPAPTDQPQPSASTPTTPATASKIVEEQRKAERERRDNTTKTTSEWAYSPFREDVGWQYPVTGDRTQSPTNEEPAPMERGEWDSPSPYTDPFFPASQNKHFVNKEEEEAYNTISSNVVDVSRCPALCDVVGSAGVKDSLLQDFIVPYFSNEKIEYTMLYGPPGTGKSLLSKAVAKSMNLPMLEITPASFASRWKGSSEKLCEALFKIASDIAPAIIFFDEAEVIFGTRRPGEDKHEEEKAILLNKIENLQDTRIFIILATNHPWAMDSAFLRRFPSRIYVSLPNHKELCEHVRVNIDRLSQKSSIQWVDLDINALATLMQEKHYSGSDVVSAFGKVVKEANTREFKKTGFDYTTDLEKLKSDLASGIISRQLTISHTDVVQVLQAYITPTNAAAVERYEKWSLPS